MKPITDNTNANQNPTLLRPIREMLKRCQDQSQFHYGKHSAYAEMAEDVGRTLEDRAESHAILASTIIEPSDAERANWPQATKDYVALIECMLFEK